MKRALSLLIGMVLGVAAILVLLAIILVFLVTRPLPKAAEPSLAAGDVVVSVEETYLAKMALAGVQSSEVVIRQVLVDVQPGATMDITVQAVLTVAGLEFTPSVKSTAALQLKDGKIAVVLQRVELAGIGVPRSSLPAPLMERLGAVEAELTRQINESLASSKLTPIGVSSDETRLTVTLKAQ